MSVISLFSWCYRSRVIAIFETRGLQLRPVPVATFLPFNPQAVTKKNPMSQRRSNDVTRRSNVRFWMEKNGTIWRFEIPKSSKSGEEIILDRSLLFRSPILQVFVAANSNAVLRLVHVDLLDSESHIARPIKTHQDGFSDGFSDWFSDWFSWVEVANGTVLQKLKAIVWLAACFESFWIPSEKILDFLS